MAIKFNSTEISTQNVEYKLNRKKELKEGTKPIYKIKILNIRINEPQSINISILTGHILYLHLFI